MRKKVDVVIVAGMIERKFYAKVLPLLQSEMIGKIYVVRREPLQNSRFRCYSPRGIWKKNLLLAEIYRIGALLAILIRHRPQVLIGIGLIMHGIYTNIFGTLFRVKKIILLMGKNDLALTYPKRRITQKVLCLIGKLAHRTGTRGTRSMQWLQEQGWDKKSIFIPHNLFEFDAFKPQVIDIRFDLIYVGLLQYYKRVDLLIAMVDKVVHTYGYANLQLAIVGKGGLLAELQQQVERLNLQQNVTFLPVGDTKYLNELFNASRIFAMTSQGEGLPMVMIEAMSCGLPAVIFDDADIADVALHEKNALLSPMWDIDDMAKNVHELLRDPARYACLAAHAGHIREEKQKEYSCAYVSDIWHRVFTEMNIT